MPIGLLGAFKFCDGNCSLKHRLLHWRSTQVEVAGWDEQFWPLVLSWEIFSQAKNASNWNLQHRWSDRKCAKLARTRGWNRQFGKLLLEPFNHDVFTDIGLQLSPREPRDAETRQVSNLEQMLDRQDWKTRQRSVDKSMLSTSCHTQAGPLISMAKSANSNIIMSNMWR